MKIASKKVPMRLFAALLTLLLLSGLILPTAASDIPYKGYNYDEWNEPIPSKAGFLPGEVYYGDQEKTVTLNAPEDLCVSEDGTIYILDSGNGRVVVLDAAFKLIKTIDKFTNEDGSTHTLFNPTGIYVRNSKLYIADYDNKVVVVSDTDGKIKMMIEKPESGTFPQESEFRPQKILCDSLGNIYVSVLGVYQGAAVFDKEGNFIDFFGSNTVQTSLSLVMDRFWKSLLNNEQADQISNYVPVQFTGFDISKNDFLYTCTGSDGGLGSRLSRVNPNGDNLWSGMATTGDLKVGYYKIHGYPTSFVDVAITEDKFLFALDSTKGRIFMYDAEGNMIFAFGGKGTQRGTFALLAGIDTWEEKVLVLDKGKSSITVFEPTLYGSTVKEALSLYNEGDYDGSKEIWEKVLIEDGNMFTAYVGIGKALFYSGKYQESIEYFRKGNDRENESRAFNEYRSELFRTAFPYAISGICILAVVIVGFLIWRKQYRKKKGRGNLNA